MPIVLSDNIAINGKVIETVKSVGLTPKISAIPIRPILDPISSPSVANITINSDYKYMAFNHSTFPILPTDANNLLIHYKFDTIPSSGGKLTNYGNLGSSYDGDINLVTSGIERIAGDRGQFKYFWKSNSANGNFLSIPNDIIKLLDTNGHSISFWTQDSDVGDYDYAILSVPAASPNNPSTIFLRIHAPWANNIVYYDIGNGINNQHRLETASSTSNSQIVHWVFVRENVSSTLIKLHIYKNGSLLISSGNITRLNFNEVTNTIFYIGYNIGVSTIIFKNKSLEDFRIYNKSLSQQEITQLFNVTNNIPYTITFYENTECDILVIGGGGGGGRRHGAGGGAGTLLYHKGQILNGTYNINVGKGGNGNTLANNNANASSGNFSEFKKSDGSKIYYANGGGVGTSGGMQAAITNGGQGYLVNSALTLPTNNVFNDVTVSVVNKQFQNTLPSPQGCRGFVGGIQVEDFKGGGGGGAGSVGQNHGVETTPNDGYGGDGLGVDITGINVLYAGGGNGSAWAETVSPVRDPTKLTIESRGGGGFGSDNNVAEAGMNGTGGGGGGQGNDLHNSGNGGSGIVIIRYKTKSLFIQMNEDYVHIPLFNNGANQTQYTITFNENTECDILVVGGGGGGGRRGGAGGGAGACIYHKNQILNGTYNIHVGNGGLGSTSQNSGNGLNGNNSQFIKNDGTKNYLAIGGAGGHGSHSAVNNSGGSGGGTNRNFNSSTLSGNNIFNSLAVAVVSGNSYNNSGLVLPEGCRGSLGSGQVENWKGGGGGGAGGIGQLHGLENTVDDGYGGDGLEIDITGINVLYAGGGNGSDFQGTISQSRDPAKSTIESRGGGGFGSDNGIAESGKNGTGGGGGGQGNDTNNGGAGGSGIVIIRYKVIKVSYNAQWTYSSTNPSVYHLGNVGIGTTNPTSSLSVVGSVSASTGISALSKSFKIEHPLNMNKWLYHGCVEAPRFDNIYRGKKIVTNGQCEVDIDSECNKTGGMTEGTFIALNTNSQLYLRNNHTFDGVKGSIVDGKIIINCQNTKDEIEIDWLVIGERKDENVVNVPLTSIEGNLICEHNIH